MSCDIDRKKMGIASRYSKSGRKHIIRDFLSLRAERNQYGTLRIFCRTPAGPEACVCLRQYNRTTGAYE